MKFASVKVQLREGGLAAARACSAHGGPWWLYWWRAVHAGTATLSVPTGSTLPLVSLPQQQGGGGVRQALREVAISRQRRHH